MTERGERRPGKAIAGDTTDPDFHEKYVKALGDILATNLASYRCAAQRDGKIAGSTCGRSVAPSFGTGQIRILFSLSLPPCRSSGTESKRSMILPSANLTTTILACMAPI